MPARPYDVHICRGVRPIIKIHCGSPVKSIDRLGIFRLQF